MQVLTAHHLLVFLLQTLALLGTAKALGLVFRHFRIDAVPAYVLAGLIWGPSGLGSIFPEAQAFLFPPGQIQEAMTQTLVWLGAAASSMLLGLQVNAASLWKQRRDCLKASLWTFLVPGLILGSMAFLGAAWQGFLPPLGSLLALLLLLVPSLPAGLAAMKGSELLKTDLGLQGATSLSGNTLAGGLALFVLLSLGQGSQGFSAILTLGGALLFCLAIFGLVRPLTNWLFKTIHQGSPNQTGANLSALVLVGTMAGTVGMLLGLQAFLGFFAAGLICGNARFLNQQRRQDLEQAGDAFPVPLFLALAGTRMDVQGDFNIGLILGLGLGGLALRCLLGYLAGRRLGLTQGEAGTFALIHSPGGEIQILAGLVALEAQMISPGVYLALTLPALAVSLFLGPVLQRIASEPAEPNPKAKGSMHGLEEYIQLHSPDLGSLQAKDQPGNMDQDRPHAGLELLLRTICYDPEVRAFCDPESTFRMLLAREEAFSTALSHGLAVPHTEVPGIRDLTVFAARSPVALDLNAPDGEDSRVFLLILIPPGKTDTHLQFLRLLAKAWSKPEARSDCLACPVQDLPARLRHWISSLRPEAKPTDEKA